jgi:hypothetical protein
MPLDLRLFGLRRFEEAYDSFRTGVLWYANNDRKAQCRWVCDVDSSDRGLRMRVLLIGCTLMYSVLMSLILRVGCVPTEVVAVCGGIGVCLAALIQAWWPKDC